MKKDHETDYINNKKLADETLPTRFQGEGVKARSKEQSVEDIGLFRFFWPAEDRYRGEKVEVTVFGNSYITMGMPLDSPVEHIPFHDQEVNLFVDTEIHFERVLQNLPNWRRIKSRAVANDAAGKQFNPRESTQHFWEIADPGTNPNHIFYPPLSESTETNSIKLDSSFEQYLTQYPLYLTLKKAVSEREPWKIQTSVIGDIDGKKIESNKDTNKAGAISKFLSSLKKHFKFHTNMGEKIIKKFVFLSKRHGDQAQALEFLRPIECVNANGTRINTKTGISTFMSYDVNACNAALSYGVPYVIFVNSTTRQYQFFYKTNLLDPVEEYKRVWPKYDEFRRKYDSEAPSRAGFGVANIDRRGQFIEVCRGKLSNLIDNVDDVVKTQGVDSYWKQFLKLITQIRVLSAYIPPSLKDLEGEVAKINDLSIIVDRDQKRLEDLNNERKRLIENKKIEQANELDKVAIPIVKVHTGNIKNLTGLIESNLDSWKERYDLFIKQPLVINKDELAEAVFEKQVGYKIIDTVSGKQLTVSLISPEESFHLEEAPGKFNRIAPNIMQKYCTDVFEDCYTNTLPELSSIILTYFWTSFDAIRMSITETISRRLDEFGQVMMRTKLRKPAVGGGFRGGGTMLGSRSWKYTRNHRKRLLNSRQKNMTRHLSKYPRESLMKYKGKIPSEVLRKLRQEDLRKLPPEVLNLVLTELAKTKSRTKNRGPNNVINTNNGYNTSVDENHNGAMNINNGAMTPSPTYSSTVPYSAPGNGVLTVPYTDDETNLNYWYKALEPLNKEFGETPSTAENIGIYAQQQEYINKFIQAELERIISVNNITYPEVTKYDDNQDLYPTFVAQLDFYDSLEQLATHKLMSPSPTMAAITPPRSARFRKTRRQRRSAY